MGYRSEVALYLTPAAKEKLSGLPKEVHELLEQAHETWEEDGHVLYYWKDIKWYDTDEAVGALHDFLDKLDLEVVEGSYMFLRVGEDVEDVEYYGLFDNPFDVRLHRCIDLPMKKKEKEDDY